MSNEPQDQSNEAPEVALEPEVVSEETENPEQDVPPIEAADEAAIAAVAALEEEVSNLKDQVLRAQAETQNARRRAEQDVEKARKYSLDKFVADLLPVADNLERAIASIDETEETQKPVLEGIELTYRSLLDTLKRHKVEVVDPEGEPFNPELHQAMSMVPNPDVEPNTVLNVFQKGYTLNGRLVRPAMVVVSNGG